MIRFNSFLWMSSFLYCILNLPGAITLTAKAADSTPTRPNIILIMCDDLGWGDVGYQGQTRFRTPNIDSLAKEGMAFSRFYSAAPVCSPTRGSCLTGRHPYRYGITFANTGHMLPEEITLAEVLKSQGYTTGHFGKWHLGTLTKTVTEANRGGPRGVKHYSPPQENGFDVCFSTESKTPTFDPMKKPATGPIRIGWDALKPGDDFKDYGTYYWDETGTQVTENMEGDDSQLILERAVPFMKQAVENQQPFLAVIWFHTPHLPVVASAEFTAPYKDLDTHTRNYYGCIEAMDQQIGRLQAELENLGVKDQTLQFFTSDNGPEGPDGDPGSAGPFRGRKRSLYEGGIRVPGVAVWPNHIPAGSASSFPAVTSDYFPTILDVLDLPMPNDRAFDGVSLRAVWENGFTQRQKPIGFESGNQMAWTINRWKLVTRTDSSVLELYDIQNDPEESENVIGDHPGIADRMLSQLKAWRKSVRAKQIH